MFSSSGKSAFFELNCSKGSKIARPFRICIGLLCYLLASVALHARDLPASCHSLDRRRRGCPSARPFVRASVRSEIVFELRMRISCAARNGDKSNCVFAPPRPLVPSPPSQRALPPWFQFTPKICTAERVDTDSRVLQITSNNIYSRTDP